MPSQKRTILETLDKKALTERSRYAGITGTYALNKAELITKLTRKRSVGLEDLPGQLGMGIFQTKCDLTFIHVYDVYGKFGSGMRF
jgi:hypothetical protein